MRTLKLEDDKARELYRTASPEFKTMLEQSFPDLFPKKFADRVKARENITWEDILKESGKTDEEVVRYRNPKNKKQKSANDYERIQILTEVLNLGVELDFTNRNQPKWIPYFERTSSGWSVGVAGRYFYYAHVGFGCYYADESVAKWAGKQFIEIYTDYLP